jgi:Ca-activated chloride channel family protein
MTMKSNPNDSDAKLTAYVLGELSDDEVEAIEDRLDGDAALRDEVNAIRATVQDLETALRAEPAPGLTDEQHETIARAGATLRADDRPVIFTLRRAWAAAGLAAAACLVVVLVPMMGRQNIGRDVAFDTDGRGTRTLETAEALEKDRSVRLRRQDPAGAVAGGLPAADDGFGGGGGRTAGEEQVATLDSFASELAAPGVAGRGGGKEQNQRARASQAWDERADGPRDAEKKTESARKGYAQRGAAAASAPVPAASAPAEGRRNGPPRRRVPPGAVAGRAVPDAAPAEPPAPEPAARARALERVLQESTNEAYGALVDNPFTRASDEPLSTFSIDVDTASYANVRRFITAGSLPPKDAVRIEELINYFDYAYEPASGEHPFSVSAETTACPWNEDHELLRIGLRGREIDRDMRPATSLVFLLDVSGSMNRPNKLPLLKAAMRMLVRNLTADDRVAIVVYAGAAGLVLPSTYCDEEEVILDALERLKAGGSTNGGAGIELAYRVAMENFIEGGVNRVILCTDGDLNVGITDPKDLDRLIEEKRKSGVFLSVLGFGTGNWKDDRMESISNKGNGNFSYIDSMDEAKKVLVEQMAGTLVTIAKDVKIQVDFNPARVGAYRLIGYANRMLEAKDFEDDTKDAGEIGAGHTVTALYEIVPAGLEDEVRAEPTSEFVKKAELVESDRLLNVKLRYKDPDGVESTPIEHPVVDAFEEQPSGDFQFAAAVAAFGMVLRDSEHKGDATFATVLDLATAGLENDANGRRAAFIAMVERARAIAAGAGAAEDVRD